MTDTIIKTLIDLAGASAIIWFSVWLVTAMQRRIGQRVGRWIYVPGVVGVPIHELSHALVALLMGHRVNKVVLFHPQNDGTLGYVEHSYKSGITAPYRNLLIAIAPFVGGVAAFYLLSRVMLPPAADVFYHGLVYARGTTDVLAVFGRVWDVIWNSPWDLRFWLWLGFGSSILLFCVPSTADFAGTKKAIALTSIIIVALALVAPAMGQSIIQAIHQFGVVLLPWAVALNLLMGLFFSVIVLGQHLFRRGPKIKSPA